MKEYQGYGGNKVAVDGNNIFIKRLSLTEECTFADIVSVSLKEPNFITNGALTITTSKNTYSLDFLKKSLSEFKELYALINSNLTESNKEISLRTGNGMYRYCLDNNYGEGFAASFSVKHFDLIQANLSPDEDVLMCFIGLHNYVSSIKHDSNFAYAITNRRIIMAQKKTVGEVVKTVLLQNISDVTLTSGALMGTIKINTLTETFNVGVNTSVAQSIKEKINGVLLEAQKQNTSQTVTNQNVSSADELKKFKELLDTGIITQEEFDAKKKQLLGL